MLNDDDDDRGGEAECHQQTGVKLQTVANVQPPQPR